MTEFDLVDTEERVAPELLMPSDFDRRLGALRQEIHTITIRSNQLIEQGIQTLEDRAAVIECGQLLQMITKNIVEFYKPIKQAIDKLKQPILDREHEDESRVAEAKTALGDLLLEFDKAQQVADEASRAAAEAAQESVPGELPLPVITVASVPAKTRGKIDRTKWFAEVIDLPKLVKAVATGNAPQPAVIANEKFLNKRADSDREGMNIPGVVARKKESVHFRS